MRFFATLSLALAALSTALPATTTKRESDDAIIGAIEDKLDSLSMTLTSDIDGVLDALGLSGVGSTVDDLLEALVKDVDGLVDDVLGAVDGLLEGLGLGAVVNTIDELEDALGLSSTNTIGTLLTKLGILPSE